MECPRVTYDSSEAVPAFQSSLRLQIRKVETSVTRVRNGAAACFLRARNVSNALGTPASLPTPPDRFWGDPAGTRHTFDNFSDFRFSHFLHGFSFKFAQRAPFGFRRSPQQCGGHPVRSIHPAVIIPPEVCILEISHFPEPGTFQENFKKRTLHATAES
jgi:hypothetical protein